METKRRDYEDQITALGKSFELFEANLYRIKSFQPTDGWDERERLPKRTHNRMKRALKNFWVFDKTYFPSESHRQGWYKPGALHKTMLKLSQTPGIHWILAHRDLAKTAYGIKLLIWLILKGGAASSGVMSQDLRKARLLIDTIEFILLYNPRLRSDFEIQIEKNNEDMLAFKCKSHARLCVVQPFSLERSPRGNMVTLDRIDFMLFDDVETIKSSFAGDIVSRRVKILVEAYKSLKASGVMLGLGNNVDPHCAANLLKKEQQEGAKRDFITVYPFPDWSNSKSNGYVGSVWNEAYPAKSASEMRKMRRIIDDEEWSQAQCDPKRQGGHIFPREYYIEYDPGALPADARGPAYCDPNNSLKSLGDTTAMGALLYSASKDVYYIVDPICRSYSDPNELLNDYLSIQNRHINRIVALGMGGHVTEESTWTAHIRNWCRINKRPYPPVMFKKYIVDNLIQIPSALYFQRKVMFPAGFSETKQGEAFLEQFWGFQGKRANKTDDAADFFICCVTLGFELGYFLAASGDAREDYKIEIVTQKFGY